MNVKQEQSSKPDSWAEYIKKRDENEAICRQIADRYPLAYEFLQSEGIEVLEYIRWEEIADINRFLEPAAGLSWEECQKTSKDDAGRISKYFPKLAKMLEALPQEEIEVEVIEMLHRAALAKAPHHPLITVMNISRESRGEATLYGNHSSEVSRPRSYYGDPKRPFVEEEADSDEAEASEAKS